MSNSQQIKEKVKERYTKVALTGDSCCGPLSSPEVGEGCCSENSSVVINSPQSAAQVSE